MKLQIVQHQVGASPPRDGDVSAYLAHEVHPVVRETRNKVNEVSQLSWAGYRAVTTDAVAGRLVDYEFRAGESARIHVRAVGVVSATDVVTQELDIHYSYDGVSFSTIMIYKDTGPIYSPDAALSSASVALVESGSRLELQVTGEDETTIVWTGRTRVQEARAT